MNKNLSRRDFLKLAGITSVSLALSACGVKASELSTADSSPSTSTPFPASTSTPSPVPTPTAENLKTNGIVQKAIDKLVVELNKKQISITKEDLLENGLEVKQINGVDENGMAKNYDVVVTSAASQSEKGGGYPVAMISSENNSVKKIDINAILGIVGIDYDIIVAWDEEHKKIWEEFIKEADTIVPDSASNSMTMAEYPGALDSYFKRTREQNGTDKIGVRFNMCFGWNDITDVEKKASEPKEIEELMRNRLQARMKYRPKEMNIILEPFDLRQDGKLYWAEDTPWYRAFGKEWIVKAFQFAKEEAEKQNIVPGKDIKFYWNDWQLDQPSAKLDLTLAIVDEIMQAGAHIDGIGIQITPKENNKYYPHEPNKDELIEVIRTIKTHALHVYVEYGTWRLTKEIPNLIPIGLAIFEACKVIDFEKPGTVTSFGVWDNYDPASSLASYMFYNKATYEPNMNYYDLERGMIRILA